MAAKGASEPLRHAVLRGQEVVPCSLEEWAESFESGDRLLFKTGGEAISVSTVFLGLDHSFGHGPPLWFETMVFGGVHDGGMARYSTWEEAAAGHEEMARAVFPMLAKDRC